LFCKNDSWEEVFTELADRAHLIMLNSLEQHRDYWLKSSEGLEKEIDIILKNNQLLSKTLVLHNAFEEEITENNGLKKIILSAKWASPFEMHTIEGEFVGPIGSLPKEFIEKIY
jgi:hypothetical protein